MKLSIYTTAFILAATITSCSVYQNTQMPDDLYYTKGADADEYLAFNDAGGYSSEDNYLRMKVRNRNRWSAFDEYDAFGNFGGYYGGWGGGMGLHPAFGFNSFAGMGWYNPWMWGSGFRFGLGMGWNSPWMMDPFFGGGWGWGHPGLGYWGGYPYGFYGGGYPIGFYPGKGTAVANKPVRSFNPGQYSRTGAYNNRNALQNTRNSNSFGSSVRNVFSSNPHANNSRVNPNYMGTSSSRPIRSYTNPSSNSSNFPTRSMSNSSSMGSRSGGGSVGSSSGGGGGISRPTRN